jgi:hypothetical protein
MVATAARQQQGSWIPRWKSLVAAFVKYHGGGNVSCSCNVELQEMVQAGNQELQLMQGKGIPEYF